MFLPSYKSPVSFLFNVVSSCLTSISACIGNSELAGAKVVGRYDSLGASICKALQLLKENVTKAMIMKKLFFFTGFYFFDLQK